MSTLRVNQIIPNTVDQIVLQGNLNVTGNINGVSTSVFTGMTATTIITTPQVIKEDINVEDGINALIVGPQVQVDTGAKIAVKGNSNLYIYDPYLLSQASTNPPSVQTATTAVMIYDLSFYRTASTFDFIFQPFKWSTIGDPTSINKPFSNITNPRSGNPYIVDFNNIVRDFLPGNRVIWMDDDASKFFDWNYTYVNPFTLQDQTWEPKGLILTNTVGILPWNSSTLYPVGRRVTYGGYIWQSILANGNKVPTTNPTPPTLTYWQNTGIPAGSGYNSSIPAAFDVFRFSTYSYPVGNWLFTAANGGAFNGPDWSRGLSYTYHPYVQGKNPVITLNVFMNSSNSNRYPTPFNVQHQLNMVDYINNQWNGGAYNPPRPNRVDMINLGSNLYNIQPCNIISNSGNPFSNGYQYGDEMVEYVSGIRANSDPVTANAKMIMQGISKIVGLASPYGNAWIYDLANPFNQNQGFIHGFYGSQSGSTSGNTVDFDIISLQHTIGYESINEFVDSVYGTAPYSWSTQLGIWFYVTMRNTIDDCKMVLSLYSKQNRIKYWCRFNTSVQGTSPSPSITIANASYSWATQTGVFLAMILSVTDSDFTGFQYNSIVDYAGCGINLLYTSTDTFGPNTTDVMGLTSVGWMFRYFLKYFQPEYGALTYQRIRKAFGTVGNTLFYDYVIGVYINSSGINGTPKHRIILCNYNIDGNSAINVDVSQLINSNWTNVQFIKISTPYTLYDPINFYDPNNGGIYITAVDEILTGVQTTSIPLYPTDYLMITAD